MGRGNSRKGANLIMQGGIMAMALLMTSACIWLRQIPLTSIWGDEGNSIYSAAFSLFSFACLITSYAVPSTLAYLLKPRIRQGQYKNAGKMIQTAFLYATITGAGIGISLFFGSVYLMERILLEPLAALSLQLLAPVVLLAAWNSVLRGFFLGNGAVFPVALSMLAEQLIALAAGFPLASVLQKYGAKVGDLLQNEAFSSSFASAGFAGGILVGTAISFLFLLLLYLISHSYYKKRNGKDSGKGRESLPQVVYIFFVCLLPVLFYGIFSKGYLLVEQILFRQFMSDSLGADIISQQWGMYFGKYKVFTALPVIMAAAMSTTLCDKIHGFCKRQDYPHMQELIRSVLRAVTVVVLPFAAMLGAFAVPMLESFFPGQDAETGGMLLLTGCITAVFFSLSYVFSEILLGMKKKLLLLSCGMAAFIVNAGALYIMLELMHLDIFGVLYADIIFSFCLVALLAAAVQKSCHFRYGLLRTAVPPFISALIMGVIMYLLSMALESVLSTLVLLILLIAMGNIIYFVLLLLMHGVTQKELRLIPGGKWIVKAAQAVRLL